MDPTETQTDPLAAMDAGIAAASETPAETTPPQGDPPPAEGTDTQATTESAAPAEGEGSTPVPGTPEALAAQQAAEAEAARKAAEAPKPDEATEAEIASLGLKEKSAARFRELASEIKALAPLKDALTAAGITDIAALPTLVTKAKNADDLIDMVTSTGSSPTQFGDALNYLTLVNKAGQGDLKAAEQAYDVMAKEMAVLAKLLGKEVPGVHDPLTDHPDLLQAVEGNTITRQHALEVAQARMVQAQHQHMAQQRDQQAQFERAAQEATGLLAQFDVQMRADPQYLARRNALSAEVAEIKRRYPPAQWLQATQMAYQRLSLIPVAIPAATPVKPPPGPVRPGRSAPTLMPTTDDPYEALNQGIAAASG